MEKIPTDPQMFKEKIVQECDEQELARKTFDGRLCVSACMFKSMPPSSNAPSPPDEACFEKESPETEISQELENKLK